MPAIELLSCSELFSMIGDIFFVSYCCSFSPAAGSEVSPLDRLFTCTLWKLTAVFDFLREF